MKLVKIHLALSVFVAVLALSTTGCDAIYRVLQKEGAEEKDLLGEIIPLEDNEKVMEVQKLLRLFGYRAGNVDGQMGVNTRNAIERFQKNNNLPVTRFVDSATWTKLNVFSEFGLVVNGDIDYGMVQQAIKNSGINPGPIDGKLGWQTKKAIKAFQEQNQLKADGVIGVQTLHLLAQYLPEKP